MAGSSKKVIIAALIGNSLIAVTKFIAAAMPAHHPCVHRGRGKEIEAIGIMTAGTIRRVGCELP